MAFNTTSTAKNFLEEIYTSVNDIVTWGEMKSYLSNIADEIDITADNKKIISERFRLNKSGFDLNAQEGITFNSLCMLALGDTFDNLPADTYIIKFQNYKDTGTVILSVPNPNETPSQNQVGQVLSSIIINDSNNILIFRKGVDNTVLELGLFNSI